MVMLAMRRETMRMCLALACLGSFLGTACKRAQNTHDLRKAVACADGDRQACRDALDVNASRCQNANGHACILQGLELESGRVVPKDEKQATELFERACALANADGCWYASTRYSYGRGVARDEARAARFAEKGCDGGSVNGCCDLATIYEYGHGRPKDLKLARDTYRRACRLSKRADGSGCAQAKRLEDTGGR